MWKSCQKRRQLEISEKKKATQLGRLAEVVKLFPFIWQLNQEAINYTGSNVSNVVSKRIRASSGENVSLPSQHSVNKPQLISNSTSL